MGTVKDISGRLFFKLTVLSFSHLGHGGAYWNCICQCGNTVTVRSAHLSTAHTTSCGCNKGCDPTHGDTGTRFYITWVSMKVRCTNPRSPQYRWYGAKGIYVCEAWINSYETFKADMWDSYQSACRELGEAEVTIDRINPQLGYSPKNCRWLSRADNTRIARSYLRSPIDVSGNS